MSSMLVVGSVAQDTIHNNLGTHPYVLGGSAVFASLAAAHFVAPRMVGVVGTDFPESSVRLLSEKGVDVSGLEIVEGRTFHWEGRYSPDLTSRESIKTELNVFADFHPKIPEAFRDTPYVMLGNIHPNLQLEVVEQMRKPKLVIADTMNFWIEGTPNELAKMLARVDLLVINEEEARQLSGEHNITRAAKEILRRGPKQLIIKRGEYGALFFDGDAMFFAPAYPLEEVVDPTGAGDTFAGGLAGYLARTGDLSHAGLRRAIMAGSAAASFCVEAVGTRKVNGLRESDVSQRLELFRKLIEVPTAS